MYQTVFATEPGSAEMPSAGAAVYAGAGDAARLATAFRSRRCLLHTGVASLEDHEPPYEEFFRVPPETADRVNAARRSGRRVVAVGTTVVRALETVTDSRRCHIRGRGLDRSRDHAGTAATRGERDDYRLARTARHASGDGQTGHCGGRRKRSGRRNSNRAYRAARQERIFVARVRRFTPDHRGVTDTGSRFACGCTGVSVKPSDHLMASNIMI